jgi:hypothetical protein
MSEKAVIMYPMGKSVASGELDHLLGTIREFRDFDYSATGVPANRSGALVRAVWVKNRNGGTLTKRQVVKWKTGYVKTGVEAAGDGDVGCGVVDPFLSTTVADGAYFWMIVEGPCELISDGASTLADTDIVVTAGAGKVNKQTAAPANETAVMVQVNSVVGRPTEAVTNVDGTTFKAIVRFPIP